MIKTFRGILADGGQEQIRLSTMKGKVGYKIVKFQALNKNPAAASAEIVAQIWKTEQSTVVATIDFSDSNLLASIFMVTRDVANESTIIVDNEIFNQDIYITVKFTSGSDDCNYYIELEVIPLTDMGAEYTTIKDLRANA